MVNVYIIITLVVAICLTIAFAGLFGWEYSQQKEVVDELNFTEWKHVNSLFNYAVDDSTHVVPLSCPVDKYMFINQATLQFYDPLGPLETSWDGHYDSYWTSYGQVNDYSQTPGDSTYLGYVGQCGFNQSIAGHLNQQCLNAKGDCTVKVNKNGSVTWGGSVPAEETAVCSEKSYCKNDVGISEDGCKLSLNISYICTSEEEINRILA